MPWINLCRTSQCTKRHAVLQTLQNSQLTKLNGRCSSTLKERLSMAHVTRLHKFFFFSPLDLQTSNIFCGRTNQSDVFVAVCVRVPVSTCCNTLTLQEHCYRHRKGFLDTRVLLHLTHFVWVRLCPVFMSQTHNKHHTLKAVLMPETMFDIAGKSLADVTSNHY